MYLFQDLFLDDSGIFSRRIRYLRARENECDGEDDGQANNELVNTESDPEKDLELLKYAVIKHTDKATVVNFLNSTRNLRLEILKDNNTDIRERFPFFFSNPELVSFQQHYQKKLA